MEMHPGELAMAREYARVQDLEHLDPEQTREIMARGRELHRWFRSHGRVHEAISIALIASFFVVDWVLWVDLARRFLADFHGMWAMVVAAVCVGVTHSLHIYG